MFSRIMFYVAIIDGSGKEGFKCSECGMVNKSLEVIFRVQKIKTLVERDMLGCYSLTG